MEGTAIQSVIDKPLFTPQYLNIEYVFGKIVEFSNPAINFVVNPDTWTTFGLVSGFLTVFCIAIIIYSLVRIYELRIDEQEEIDRKIQESVNATKEKNRNENPRWIYIQTLIESSNSSDWRVAVMEADSMMEEILKDRGLSGSTASELLEGAKESGYRSIQDAWDGHLIRNQIAHQGSDFPFSQIEGRRVIRLFQNFFEELGAI